LHFLHTFAIKIIINVFTGVCPLFFFTINRITHNNEYKLSQNYGVGTGTRNSEQDSEADLEHHPGTFSVRPLVSYGY